MTLDFDYTNEVEINKVEDEKIDNFYPTKFTKYDIRNRKKWKLMKQSMKNLKSSI